MRPRSRTALAAVAIYLAVALLGGGTASGEVFPFFDWNLFSRVPGETVRAAIYLEPSAGGGERAVALTESGQMRGQAITASSLARDLWKAERDGDDAGGRATAAAIVANHLPVGARWSLRVERFLPEERFRDGTVVTETVAVFERDRVVAP